MAERPATPSNVELSLLCRVRKSRRTQIRPYLPGPLDEDSTPKHPQAQPQHRAELDRRFRKLKQQ
ncbi:uncharacterized protein LY89DRAFT_242998 [Mollisia scopiformis]|uniref:Uncharacterized protein n=1 Tax=Mollisia scopiformis TaxID=149040 RepID=A0A194WTR7_MOLSC|nr:uncharacterized protein LY89DRAFT_242998 [Mollisia scopiformis]KUJ11353.1 hypothetical protein LY89DRAFT_242998 [Mollisia scopiformis]